MKIGARGGGDCDSVKKRRRRVTMLGRIWKKRKRNYMRGVAL
jgi:hypothetical protein